MGANNGFQGAGIILKELIKFKF